MNTPPHHTTQTNTPTNQQTDHHSGGSGASGNAVGGLLPSVCEDTLSLECLHEPILDDLLTDDGAIKLPLLLLGLRISVDHDILSDASQSVTTTHVMPLSRSVSTLSGRPVGSECSLKFCDDHDAR